MIWMSILSRLGHPIVLLFIGLLLNVAVWVALWHGGKAVGYSEGVTDQIMKQVEADAVGADEIRERVRDALDQVGLDSDDADVDAILRGLGGQ